MRPALTSCDQAVAFSSSAAARCSSAGTSTVCTASVAARCTEVGNTSFEDWEALTSSFGCTGRPRRFDASDPSTSLMFMFDEVPLPVW